MKQTKTIRVTLVKSQIGSLPQHRRTLKALGLRKINSSATHTANKSILGMIQSVTHLVRCEEVKS